MGKFDWVSYIYRNTAKIEIWPRDNCVYADVYIKLYATSAITTNMLTMQYILPNGSLNSTLYYFPKKILTHFTGAQLADDFLLMREIYVHITTSL